MICERATVAYPDGRTGTDAGYQAHRKAGEDVCEPCIEAHVEKGALHWTSLTDEQRAKVRSANKEHHAKYRTNSAHKAKAASRRYREVNRAIISDAKSQPCADCGVQYPYYVMQFDHLGDKVLNVSYAKSLRQAKAEISKCEVRCANCHSIKTHERRQAHKSA